MEVFSDFNTDRDQELVRILIFGEHPERTRYEYYLWLRVDDLSDAEMAILQKATNVEYRKDGYVALIGWNTTATIGEVVQKIVLAQLLADHELLRAIQSQSVARVRHVFRQMERIVANSDPQYVPGDEATSESSDTI